MRFNIQEPGVAAALIERRVRELPPALSHTLRSDSFRSAVATVGRIHTLPSEDMVLLENEVALVLLAFEPYMDLARNLSEDLGLPGEKAERIAQDLTNAILAPDIKLELDAIYKKRTELIRPATPKTGDSQSTASVPVIEPESQRVEETPRSPIIGYAQARGVGVPQAPAPSPQMPYIAPIPPPPPVPPAAPMAPAPAAPPHNLPTQQSAPVVAPYTPQPPTSPAPPPTAAPAVPPYRRPMTDAPRYQDGQGR